jgi:hypothetical protein
LIPQNAGVITVPVGKQPSSNVFSLPEIYPSSLIVETGEFGDLVKVGVIDPAKVTRLALQNAASIVSLMLTTEVLIADLKGEEKMAAAAAGYGGAY